MRMEVDVLKINCVYEIVKEQVKNENSKPQKLQANKKSYLQQALAIRYNYFSLKGQ